MFGPQKRKRSKQAGARAGAGQVQHCLLLPCVCCLVKIWLSTAFHLALQQVSSLYFLRRGRGASSVTVSFRRDTVNSVVCPSVTQETGMFLDVLFKPHKLVTGGLISAFLRLQPAQLQLLSVSGRSWAQAWRRCLRALSSCLTGKRF